MHCVLSTNLKINGGMLLVCQLLKSKNNDTLSNGNVGIKAFTDSKQTHHFSPYLRVRPLCLLVSCPLVCMSSVAPLCASAVLQGLRHHFGIQYATLGLSDRKTQGPSIGFLLEKGECGWLPSFSCFPTLYQVLLG